jgi:hypothetical protein
MDSTTQYWTFEQLYRVSLDFTQPNTSSFELFQTVANEVVSRRQCHVALLCCGLSITELSDGHQAGRRDCSWKVSQDGYAQAICTCGECCNITFAFLILLVGPLTTLAWSTRKAVSSSTRIFLSFKMTSQAATSLADGTLLQAR